MRIRTQIISLAILLLIFMLSAAVYSLRQLNTLGAQLQELVQLDVPLTQVLTEVTVAQLQQSNSFERALRFAREASDKGNIPFEEARAEYHRLEKLVLQALDEAELLTTQATGNPAVGATLVKTREKIKLLKRNYTVFSEHSREIISLLSKGRSREAELEALVIPGEEEEIRQNLETLLNEIVLLTKSASKRAAYIQTVTVRESFWISIMAGIVGLVLALLITHSITNPIGVALNVAREIASGNKDVSIDTSYSAEVGELLLAMRQMRDAIRDSERTLLAQAEELRRSNDDLERFAYIASHDLQEPLRMVASYTQLLAKRYEGKLDKDADEFIGFAVEGATRMRDLISDLLSYSRVGRMGKEFSRVDINEVLSEVKDNLTVLIHENSATIAADLLPQVKGDKVQLTQLFQNIVGNAVKFHGAEPPQIQIKAEALGDMWRFAITDNGIGMEEKYFARIFEVFQRLHSKDKYPGTGIGLAIVKKIIERHGGEIWVESELGRGTTFYFTLMKG